MVEVVRGEGKAGVYIMIVEMCESHGDSFMLAVPSH